MSVSIRDVAKACGVSTYTVSSVINSKGRVSADTRERVLEIVRSLNYNPTRHSSQSNTLKHIGLVLPFGATTNATFYMRALMSAKKTTTALLAQLHIFSQDEIHQQIETEISSAKPFNCDAFVYFAPKGGWIKDVELLSYTNIPVAVVRRSKNIENIYQIYDDDYAGAKKLTRFLIERGYRCIALIGPVGKLRDEGVGQARLRGYRDAVTEHKLEFDQRLILPMSGNNQGNYPCMREQAGPAIADLHQQGLAVDAVVCLNDGLIAHLMSSLQHSGYNVPNDLAVAGYGNEEICSHFIPSITSLNIPVEEMVDQAIRCLLSEKEQLIRAYTFNNDIIIRDSTPDLRT